MKWEVGKSTDGTIFVESICRTLNDKHKERILNAKNIDGIIKDYFVSLTAQYLIHTDGKNYEIGYKEIEFGEGEWYESKDTKKEGFSNSDFLEILHDN